MKKILTILLVIALVLSLASALSMGTVAYGVSSPFPVSSGSSGSGVRIDLPFGSNINLYPDDEPIGEPTGEPTTEPSTEPSTEPKDGVDPDDDIPVNGPDLGGVSDDIPAPSEEDCVLGEEIYDENEEMGSGIYIQTPYFLIESREGNGNVTFTTEAYKAVSGIEIDAAIYEIDSWLLDQMGAKLDTVDGDRKNVRFTLGASDDDIGKMNVKLPSDGKLMFPCEDKGLLLRIPDCGEIAIHSQAADYTISLIEISIDEDSVHFAAYSEDSTLRNPELFFEPEEETDSWLFLSEGLEHF